MRSFFCGHMNARELSFLTPTRIFLNRLIGIFFTLLRRERFFSTLKKMYCLNLHEMRSTQINYHRLTVFKNTKILYNPATLQRLQLVAALSKVDKLQTVDFPSSSTTFLTISSKEKQTTLEP